MCVLLGVFHEFPVNPYYEPLAWFMISRGGRYYGYIVKPRYSFKAITILHKFLYNSNIVISVLSRFLKNLSGFVLAKVYEDGGTSHCEYSCGYFIDYRK